MFFQRLVTSLILAPLVLLTLFFGPKWFLITVLLLATLAISQECLHLIPLKKRTQQILFIGLMFVALWLCHQFFSYWLCLGLVVWIFNFIAILTFPKSRSYWGHVPIVALWCLLLMPLFVVSLMHLYHMPEGKSLILYLLFLVWASDIGAYLSGKQWGKHKIIPKVSPGKSWEGVFGGVLLALVVAWAGYYYFAPFHGVYWFILAFFTVLISIFGDLFISILKRRCHLKDTGTLIPGHGGLLDRLDSLIAALPWFYFGLTLG